MPKATKNVQSATPLPPTQPMRGNQPNFASTVKAGPSKQDTPPQILSTVKSTPPKQASSPQVKQATRVQQNNTNNSSSSGRSIPPQSFRPGKPSVDYARPSPQILQARSPAVAEPAFPPGNNFAPGGVALGSDSADRMMYEQERERRERLERELRERDRRDQHDEMERQDRARWEMERRQKLEREDEERRQRYMQEEGMMQRSRMMAAPMAGVASRSVGQGIGPRGAALGMPRGPRPMGGPGPRGASPIFVDPDGTVNGSAMDPIVVGGGYGGGYGYGGGDEPIMLGDNGPMGGCGGGPIVMGGGDDAIYV